VEIIQKAGSLTGRGPVFKSGGCHHRQAYYPYLSAGFRYAKSRAFRTPSEKNDISDVSTLLCRNNRNSTMAKRSRTYIWQFVIGLGLLSGIWTAIGIDPESIILNVLGDIVGRVYADPGVRSLLLLIPSILLVVSIIGAYRQGSVLGLISVVVAYTAGLVILVSTMTSLVLLGIAIIVGYLATNRRLRKKLTGT
jgi:hypothetical protein